MTTTGGGFAAAVAAAPGSAGGAGGDPVWVALLAGTPGGGGVTSLEGDAGAPGDVAETPGAEVGDDAAGGGAAGAVLTSGAGWARVSVSGVPPGGADGTETGRVVAARCAPASTDGALIWPMIQPSPAPTTNTPASSPSSRTSFRFVCRSVRPVGSMGPITMSALARKRRVPPPDAQRARRRRTRRSGSGKVRTS